jgi:hypothetical protein
MSSFDVAFQFLMDNEDAARAYAEVPDAPPGAHAISGINSAKWPFEYKIIANIPQGNPDRATLVEAFYRQYFWENTPNGGSWYAQLTSDEVAKRVFDAAVNAGSVAAVKCLQRACNSFPIQVPLIEDGGWGPLTVAKANILDPDSLVTAFQQARVAHYKAIVAANPADAVYLAAWTVRAER